MTIAQNMSYMIRKKQTDYCRLKLKKCASLQDSCEFEQLVIQFKGCRPGWPAAVGKTNQLEFSQIFGGIRMYVPNFSNINAGLLEEMWPKSF